MHDLLNHLIGLAVAIALNANSLTLFVQEINKLIDKRRKKKKCDD